ncbi:MAG TPA: hypothetical protein VF461_05250 [Gemmatimonadaceae bacterium]
MPRKSSTDATPRTELDTKRPYVRPVLKRYGDLAQLTQAKGKTGTRSDGAIANNNKTQ